ncbi:MAG: N-6 DNA methylase [Burkholderiales bacterium]
MATSTVELRRELEALGAPRATILELQAPSPSTIEYLDLLRGVDRGAGEDRRIQPAAVIEFERRPLLYVVEASALADDPVERNQDVATLRAKLACRGDIAYLAVHDPGRITVYSLGLQRDLPEGVSVEVDKRPTFIQDLTINGWAALQPAGDRQRRANERAFHDVLLDLVTDANQQLLASAAFKGRESDVLSLVGRALFARFLIDRGFMNQATFPSLRGSDVGCFDTVENAVLTCKWLDDTFNGELLQLSDENYPRFFARIVQADHDAMVPLARIVRRAPGGQLSMSEAWADIDFAHVPTGLLSEVYEQFAHAHGPSLADATSVSLARAESIHYTPRAIAEFIVEQSLGALIARRKRGAKVLDPAAGAGVFLVCAYRHLVATEWRMRGRPSRKRLREILYQQIRGFDINLSALKLAALSLYLTALELDPDIQDVQGIGFHPMIGSVLTLARREGEGHPNPYVLGSLGAAIGNEHNEQYDLVVGNPPWTSWKGARAAALNEAARANLARLAAKFPEHAALQGLSQSYKNPDNRPDLPFVWRAMEWAKPDGVIAFALHARILFNRDGGGASARQALFSTIKVVGILNGSALRMQGVWPNIVAPWCLLFARNTFTKGFDAFNYLSPQIESALNDRGVMRVDYASAEPIESQVLAQRPTLLKELFRGTELDAEIMQRLEQRGLPTLQSYWRGKRLASGEGYKVKGSDPRPAPHMQGWPDLRRERKSAQPRFALDAHSLPPFAHPTLERARDPGIYEPPLLLLPVSIQHERDNGVGLLATSRVAYSESFFGFSAAGFAEGAAVDLARYLHVLTASTLFIYYALMTSSQFGVERDTLQKEDVDSFPVVPFDQLEAHQIARLRALSHAIEGGQRPWQEVDAFVAQVYALTASEQRVIADTLAVASPYASQIRIAESPPSSEQVREYASELQALLKPHFSLVNVSVRVSVHAKSAGGWTFLSITTQDAIPSPWLRPWLSDLGRHAGATQIIVEAGPLHLGVAMVSQYRYWVRSRARLCAREIVSRHSNHLLPTAAVDA